MSNRTPGPWRVARRGLEHSGPAVRIFGGGYQHNYPVCDPINDADAEAIAAVPDLIAACRQAIKLAWEVGCESEDGVLTLLDDSRGDLYRQLRDVLVKAGEL